MGNILIAYENFVIYNYCVMSKRPGKYIYSNKKHTEKGIFSTVLAALSFTFLILMLVVSYLNKGEVKVLLAQWHLCAHYLVPLAL